ncbi:MAG: nucleotidyltransferase domain-containing protein [Melioribacteraceae bacterium]|nr:nucleotidyltransferase domain-containing protein [Melioribacteraceae bacterium]
MDKIPFEIKSIIEKYLQLLQKNNIKLKSDYLFGSYSRGIYTEWSDIDIALASSEEFTTENPLAKEIMKTGILLA